MECDIIIGRFDSCAADIKYEGVTSMVELMRWLGYSNDVKLFLLTTVGWSLLLTGLIISTILLIGVLSHKADTWKKFSQLFLESVALVTIFCGGYLTAQARQTPAIKLHDKFELVKVENNIAIYRNRETGSVFEAMFEVGKDESVITPKETNKKFTVKNEDIFEEVSIMNSPV